VMTSLVRRLSLSVVALILAFCGGLLCILSPERDVAAQTARTFQVWPERSIGVVSGRLEGSVSDADTSVFPIGIVAASSGGVVRGRTYLLFPMDVLPPGTDILQATLHFQVDSVSNPGHASAGVYRVLEPWGETGWSVDPVTWPALLTVPQDVISLEFGVVESAHWQSPLAAGTAPASPLPTLTRQPALTPTPLSSYTPAPFVSPVATPTRTPTATPPSSPLPTLYSIPASSIWLVAIEADWFTWDVTALMRSWLSGEVANYGLAIGAAPSPGAGIEEAGNLLAVRYVTATDAETRPYVIVQAEVRAVTLTPNGSSVLPSAGLGESRTEFGVVGVILLGVALVLVGVVLSRA